MDAVLEDRRVKEEEYETRRQRDEEKIRILTEKYVSFMLAKTTVGSDTGCIA